MFNQSVHVLIQIITPFLHLVIILSFGFLLSLLFPKQALDFDNVVKYYINEFVHVLVHTIEAIVDYFISK